VHSSVDDVYIQLRPRAVASVIPVTPSARRARPLLLAIALLLAGAAPVLAAPQVPSDTAAQAAGGEAEAPDSPRATMRQFLALARRGEFERASTFLTLDRKNGARGADLAQRLHQFIQRRVAIDLDSISPLPQGNPSDGEPPLQDRIGRMRVGPGQVTHPIVLVRSTQRGETRWLISSGTVAEADTAYETLDSSWTAGRLSPSLREPGPLGVQRWKWIGGILGVPVVWLITLALGFLLHTAANAVTRRTRVTWDDELVAHLRGPVRLFVASVLAALIPVALELDYDVQVQIWRVLQAVTVGAVFWMLLRAIGLAQDQLARRAWAADHTNARTIIPLAGRSLRVALGLVALLVVFSQFGYPVGTVLAGLGIGGLVVALAAQKTVENLFGSVSLAADRVFRIGDWVKVEDVQGSVERIGLRSTHVRTLDRTLVKFPNGKLAELRIESFGERDRIRFFTTLNLDYATTAAQLRAVLSDVEALLRQHPRAWPEGIAVRFAAFGQNSLDVTVNAWFATTDGAEFEAIRQEVLLGIMDAIERAGTRLAVPTQIMRVERNGAGPFAHVPAGADDAPLG
jgi:MscS family membrane protein